MIVSLPRNLPATVSLREEGLVVVEDDNPIVSLLDPLRIALVNLMPDKRAAELQFARALAQAPHPVHLTLARPQSHVSRNTPAAHLDRFYCTIPELCDGDFDALIVTGAPVETLEFEEVDYWAELCSLLDWTERHVPCSLFICWGAQAALYHHHGIPKVELPRKASGVFEQTVHGSVRPILQGMGDSFPVPVSRHTEVEPHHLKRRFGLETLASSPETGLCLVEDRPRGALMMFNHLEYDTLTLDAEYHRDRKAGVDVSVPAGYYPAEDAARLPVNSWAPAARTFYANWVNEVAQVNSARRASAETAVMPYAVAG